MTPRTQIRSTVPASALAVALAIGLTSCSPQPTIAPEQPVDVLESGIEAVRTAHFTVVSASPTQTMAIEGELDITGSVTASTSSAVSSDDATLVSQMISIDGALWRNEGDYSVDQWVLVPDPPPIWDPLRDLPGLLDAASSVVHTGRADLDGVAADHYTVTIDADLLPEELLATGPIPEDGATYDVYLDDDGVLLGHDTVMDGFTIESRLSAVNEEVSIEPPPADLVMSPEAAELLFGLG